MRLDRIYKEIHRELQNGNIDGARERRDELEEVCRGTERSNPMLPDAVAMCCNLFLANVQRERALRIMIDWEYIQADSSPDHYVLQTLAKRSTSQATNVASAVADTLFRIRRYEDAWKVIDQHALRALTDDSPSRTWDASPSQRASLHIRTLARAARIQWHLEPFGEGARGLLKKAIEKLEEYATLPDTVTTAEARSLEAFIFDIWSCYDWTAGRQSLARAKIGRAISALRRPIPGPAPGRGLALDSVIHDSSRLANSYLSYCRIESSAVTGRRYVFLIEMLDDAWDLFPVDNGLRPQTMILKAFIQVKAGKPLDALATLDQLENDVGKLEDPVQRANTSLCRIWAHRGLRGHANEALEEVARLEQENLETKLPRHLEIEVLLQRGCCLLEAEDPRRLKPAIKALREARDLAKTCQRVKFEIAARLKLVEAYLECGREEEASSQMRIAVAKLATTRSTYLSTLYDRIATRIDPETWTFPVRSSHWKTEYQRFRQAFVRRAEDGHRSISEIAKEIGMDRKEVSKQLPERTRKPGRPPKRP